MKLPIRLDQYLKLIDVAQTGGHAKFLIQNGDVSVNGEVEYRRGRKLHAGDMVTIADQNWTVSQ